MSRRKPCRGDGGIPRNHDDTMNQSSDSEPELMTATECCASLSAALENGILLIRNDAGAGSITGKESGGNDAALETATTAFVEILSSSAAERSTYFNTIRSKKFQKRHARRLFAALVPILKHTFDSEHHVPLSAFEQDGGYSDEDSIAKVSTAKRSSLDSRKRSSDISKFSDCSIVPDEASTEAMRFIKYSASIVHAYLDNQMSRRKNKSTGNANDGRVFDMIEEVYVVAELLHNNLFDLNSCGREGMAVQRAIIEMCEVYWKGNFTDCEVLVTQLMPLLVVRSLNGNATKADLKRLWSMRQALVLLDFQDESTIVELKKLLLTTVSSPLYIKHPEGRKIIAFLFQLDVSLVKDLHHSIKAQIPLAKSAYHEAYGEIYFAAWKEAAENTLNESRVQNSVLENISDSDIEENYTSEIQSAVEDAIQNLMYASLHAPSPHMAKAILAILEPLHSHKKNPAVDSLLYRLYNPILWRALSATNPLVRIHGSTALHKTFPLHDPNAGKVHLKEVNEKSVEVLIRLLNDDDPKVRIAGCDAAIRVLGLFWDALKSEHIRSLLNEIIMKHANDSSSAAVRVQAVKGITVLLDAKASHGVIRPLLPIIGDHIHDSVERVRLACVRLLIKLKGMKGIKYYHVVPSNHILARLALEGEGSRKSTGRPVALAITELLVNSYFPKGAKGEEQMRRTLHFIVSHPAASRIFYTNVSKYLGVNNTSKLVAMLIKTIKIGVENEKRSIVTRISMDRNSNKTTDMDPMRVTASNTHLMVGVAEILHIVLKSIWNELLCEENSACLDFIQNSISGNDLTQLCAYFEDLKSRKGATESDATNWARDCDKICTSLLCCATFITSQNVTEFCSHIADRINSRRKTNMVPYFAALCSWGMQNEVASSLSKSINEKFDNMSGLSGRRRSSTSQLEESHCSRSKRKQSCLSNSDEANSSEPVPRLTGEKALQMIGEILSGRDFGAVSIREAILSSEIACSAIERALEKATILADKILTGTVKYYCDKDCCAILLGCEIYGRFILHKDAMNSFPIRITLQTRDYLIWMTNRVIKALLQIKDKENVLTSSPFGDLNLSRISAIGSRTSEIQPPLSPLPISPPRRRSNINNSPSNIDSSFVSMEERGASEFTVKAEVSSSVRSQALGISLVKSSMNVFGEWLLVGVEDGSEIVKHIKEWCQIMNAKNHCLDAKAELFPSLCRLAVLSGKATFEYDLFLDILHFHDTLDAYCGGREVLTDAINSIVLLRGKHSTKHIANLAGTIINSIPSFMVGSDGVAAGDWDKLKDYGWAVAIETMLKHGKSIPILVKTLLQTLESTESDEFVGSIYIKILELSCEKCSRGKIGAEVKEVLLNYTQDKPRAGGLMKSDDIKILLDTIFNNSR